MSTYNLAVILLYSSLAECLLKVKRGLPQSHSLVILYNFFILVCYFILLYIILRIDLSEWMDGLIDRLLHVNLTRFSIVQGLPCRHDFMAGPKLKDRVRR